MRGRSVVLLLALLVAIGAAAWLGQRARSRLAAGTRAERSAAPVLPRVAHTPTAVPADASVAEPGPSAPPLPSGALRYLAIAGGSFPESSEVSLEQNLELAKQVLGGPGALLFAGGSGSFGVRTLDDDDEPAGDDLLQRVGDIFAPRSGRRSRYRKSTLPAAPATLRSVEAQLEAALAQGSEPLLLFVATHGDQGEHAADNQIVLWGGDGLTPARIAELHEAHPRPLRVVAASCFSGGFAELAFAHADARAGVTRAPRCGLFAGTWDRETSGCDPDPERRNQEGYSLHFLQALRGRDRAGAPLPARDLDYDADGRISLLEAHAWATIAGQSIDVPTTTSERYLRSVQARSGRSEGALLPEYAAVEARLSARLGLASEAAVRVRWEDLDHQLSELDQRVEQAQGELDAAYGALAGRLLARWPVLDDPYHAEFAALFAREHDAIDAALRDWPEAHAYAAADDAEAELEDTRSALEAEEAVVARLLRAQETLRLAGGLHARGGAPWAHYLELVACERFVPVLAASPGP